MTRAVRVTGASSFALVATSHLVVHAIAHNHALVHDAGTYAACCEPRRARHHVRHRLELIRSSVSASEEEEQTRGSPRGL